MRFADNKWNISTTRFRSQIGSQLGGQQKMKLNQSDQKRNSRLASLLFPYFGMHMAKYSSATLKMEQLSIAKIIGRSWCFRKKKFRPQMKKKNFWFTMTVHLDKTSWIAL